MSAFNGSGTFVIVGAGLPVVPGTTISSTVANQLNADLATGLSTCITRDGQSVTTASIPFVAGAKFGSAQSTFDATGNLAMAGTVTIPNSTTALVVGNGSAPCQARLFSNDSFVLRLFNSSYSLTLPAIIGMANDGADLNFSNSVGSLLARINQTTGAYTAISDADLKTKRETQTDYMPGIRALWIGEYDWKSNGKLGFGVLAQQAYEVLGGIGVTPGNGDEIPWTVDPATFGYLALWGVQKLAAENEALKARLAAIEAKLGL